MTDSESSGRRQRRGLGRGLDALLPPAAEPALRTVPIDRIRPNPRQPRLSFDRQALAELSASIREHGVLQPLVVSSLPAGDYQIIVGERRWQAARLAGLSAVPVLLKDATDQETLELALIENVQRADLNPLEEAAAYQRLIGDFGLTQQRVADRVGKSRVAVSNTLRLLALPEEARRSLNEGRVTEGHARALLGLGDHGLLAAALDRVEREGLTVRQTEELVRRMNAAPDRPPVVAPPPDVAALEAALERALGSKVRLRPGKRGGSVVIQWTSNEEFEGLRRRLLGEE